MRIYLGTTLNELSALWSTQQLGEAVGSAHAVTGGLRARHEGADDEELEYAALMAAAADAYHRIGKDSDPDQPPRRVVVAADVPDDAIVAGGGPEPSSVTVITPVPLRAVASVHVDEAAAAPLLQAAREGSLEAAESLAEVELLWFATQEIPAVLAGD